ncbi:HD-GYP domain-containing protein [Sporomusa sp.]|uniref:HD-GYP domain-containing protein n=1 Tax=Sporomusa sp. TaxID=2078658 RepID=UPI002C26916B|nr:HD-GYP domain-containing protein [Sporomusa sp.]HWR42629.1 HD-GYP domain-containing protein [Sporomusa sp.]
MFLNQYLLRVEELKPGMVVAQAVVSDTGQVLLEQGVFLTEEYIENLSNWQIINVSIVLPYKGRSSEWRFFSMYKDTLDSVAETFKKVRAFKEVPIAECKELVENYIELIVNIVGVIDDLYNVKSHNEYTFKHSLNVAIISGVLGKWLGFKGQKLKDIILAGLLHDIGKALIPENILDKPGKLTDEEMAIIRTHPAHGYHLLADCFEISEEVKLGILQHHEREDGSGYPLGSSRGDIHIYAKIVAIADIYDAMSTERVYRRKLLPFTVVEIILEQMYDKLNPQICLTFLAHIRRFLLGSSVLLNDGSKAKVVLLNELLRVRPVVQLESGDLIDLEGNRKLEVVEVLDEVNTA